MASVLLEQIESYLAACEARGLSPRTLEHSYGYSLRSVLLPWAEAAGLGAAEDFTQRHLDAFQGHLLKRQSRHGRPLSRASVSAYSRPVGHFLAWLRAEGLAVNGKPRGVVLRRPAKEILSPDELTRMEEMARTERDKLIVRLLGGCALRATELVILRPDDLLEDGRRHFVRVRGKGRGGQGSERLVPVKPPQLWRRLQRFSTQGRPEDCADALFLTHRARPDGSYQGLGVSGLDQLIRFLARQAGIKRRVYPHLLRHTCITRWAQDGLNEYQLKAIAGNYSAIEVYVHIAPQQAYDFLP